MKRQFGLFIFILFFISLGWAQDVSLVSYFPTSAYTTNRLLPFHVNGMDGAKVTKIEINTGVECQGVIDPHHNGVFHLLCAKPSVLNADIRFEASNGDEFVLPLLNLIILQDSPPVEEETTENSSGDETS